MSTIFDRSLWVEACVRKKLRIAGAPSGLIDKGVKVALMQLSREHGDAMRAIREGVAYAHGLMDRPELPGANNKNDYQL